MHNASDGLWMSPGYFPEPAEGSLADMLLASPSGQTTPSTPCEANDQFVFKHGTQAASDIFSSAAGIASPTELTAPPKIGGRFSKDVVRTLKNWLAVHKYHPYPSEEEMSLLLNHTGLNKTQVLNWFANARRRDHMQSARPASPQIRTTPTSPVDIITRPGTPAPRRNAQFMNPMERWVDSPPEHEPAAVHDIARAIVTCSEISTRTLTKHGSRISKLVAS